MPLSEPVPASWPVLTRYDADHLAKIALPLGGIGTGTVSLGGRGDLRDWEIVNRPAKGFTPLHCFFALWTRPDGGEAKTRLLEGPLDLSLYEGSNGSEARNHGWPRFRHAEFEAAYPLGQVLLSDPTMPLSVRMQAFNPLVPTDSERSGLPVAVIRFVLTNSGTVDIAASVCGSVQNFIGDDGTSKAANKNRNAFREADGLSGVFLTSEGVAPDAETWGTMALSVLHTEQAAVTHRTTWVKRNWGDSLLDFWDDFSADGKLDERDYEPDEPRPVASLASPLVVPAGGTASVTFLLTWGFPNRLSWTPGKNGAQTPTVGNYYTGRFADAWDATRKIAADLPALEADTVQFVQAFCQSDLPDVVKEAALYNVSTLRTQTVFRTPDGRLFGWEGCNDNAGCCNGSCTHVWNYEVTTAFLFGDLSRTMREVELAYATVPETGHMSFRTNLPLSIGTTAGLAAADGQMGCLMKLYRDWKLCGNDDFLRELWPRAKKALEFCWIKGGWDADKDGVMEGCQHNTMDVEYYGPNPQMGAWYLGALRASEEMARHLGETDFASECRRLFESGRHFMDTELFNGDYYEHHIIPAMSEDAIAPGLRHGSMGARDLAHPELQLGAGCLIDQLVGQYLAHVCGLGYLLDPAHVKKTLESLMRWNFKTELWDHFNHMRSYALGDESALLMATYPKGRRPTRPFPYYNEVMTGYEHQAAVHMMYEGMENEGMAVLSAVRARYDGKKRSPFDEAECGHHYSRAMAAWAYVLALSGFAYDGVTQTMTFARPSHPANHFWSTGSAWGTVAFPDTETVALRVHGGVLFLRTLWVGEREIPLAAPAIFRAGDTYPILKGGNRA